MALFFDGFDQFARTERPEQLIRLAGYTLEGTATMVAGRKPNSYSMSLYRGALSRMWAFTGGIMSLGFAVKFDGRGPMVAIRANNGDLTNLLVLAADPVSGLLNMNGMVGYVNPLKDRWYYIELELDKTSGQARVFVNGKPDVVTTLPTLPTQELLVRLNPYDADKNDFATRLYDDFYVTDAARLKPMQITTRFPTAEVSTDWNVTGTPSHFTAVSPPIDMLDKFIYATAPDALDSFTSSTTLPDDNPVKYLQLITLFRKATADPMSLQLNIDDQKVTESNISRDWTFRYTQFSPAGYTAKSIVPSEFGVRLKL